MLIVPDNKNDVPRIDPDDADSACSGLEFDFDNGNFDSMNVVEVEGEDNWDGDGVHNN